ncbi:PD-(D/E)XK nuclease family protein [Paenibacillus baimaensis]|uniref:PD-(D/E)XK nuclease family protein n=1 Tax=Paenibacillus baimaensis TaxID=2982185 RepID=UPI0021CE8CB9|nr:PD-(D/E)XK nuclease family protein [Paenibacillus sp. WQ 127069]
MLTTSHAQGHQWLEQVSRQYGPVLNTEVRVLDRWALDRCKLLLAKIKFRYVSDSESRWIVVKLLQELTEDTGFTYLTGNALTPGLTKAFHQAVLDLRGALIKAAELTSDVFENREKGIFVKELLSRYEAELVRNRLVDLAGLLPYVKQLSPTNDCIIVDEYAIRTSLVGKSFLESLTGGVYIALNSGHEFMSADSSFPVERTEFFHSLGSLAEVREVVRRIMEKGISWDQVEIIASDYEKRAAAVYTVTTTTQIACTFSDGLPIGITNAGKAAKLYLEWLESGYHLDSLLSALKQGVIRLRDEQQMEITSSNVIGELERSGIGWGQERYRLWGQAMETDTSKEQMLIVGNQNEARSALLKILHRFFEHLFQPLTEQTLSSPAMLIHTLISFLETYVVLNEDSDDQVLSGLQSLEQSFHMADELTMNSKLALRYVQEGLEGLRIQSKETPSPGRIHVTSLSSGGQTGRPYTFIIGMAEKNWSLSVRQDPLLLDEERARISPDMDQSIELAQRQVEERDVRMGMIRGDCTLSFCSYDIVDHREHMPAYEMLQMFRGKTLQTDADYEAMVQSMEEPVRFFRSKAGLSVDASEQWLRSLVTNNSRIKAGQAFVYAYYGSLMDGNNAELSRENLEFSAYDGLIETNLHPVRLPGDEHTFGGSAFSASRLELYGRCPKKFFYQEIIGVRAKEVALYDRTRWLDAMQRGSLLHEIFDQYLIDSKGRRTDLNGSLGHDLTFLNEITEEVLRQYAKEVPAPSMHILHKEAESIRKDVNIFYLSEQRRTSIPVFTELQLHREGKPLVLEFSNELSIPIKGFVDRVDRVAPHHYKIYDYKTGNPRKYKQNECFSRGTQLQLPLYGLAVEQWMKETGFDPEAQIVASAYYFPTERGMGEEVSRPQNRREDLESLLYNMMESMRTGLYPPAIDPIGCTWCDYNSVCGSHSEQFLDKRSAPGNADRLERILEVNRFV